MTQEQEQLSDLLWASKVLNGRGDTDDSSSHASWILSVLSVNGCTAAIRKAARSKLQECPTGAVA